MNMVGWGDYLHHPARRAAPPRPMRGVTFALWLALGVEAFFAVLSIAAYALRLHVIKMLETGGPLSQQAIASSNHFVHVVAELSIPMIIIVQIILLVWVHEARKDLEAFRSGPFRFSSAFAVWSFIIPFANFWLPYLVLREIWKGSDPGLAPFSPEPFWTRRGSPLVVAWWVVFLVNNLFGVAVAEFVLHGGSDTSLGHFRLAAELNIASGALRLASLAVTAGLAHRVLCRQEALALQLASGPWTSGPWTSGPWTPGPWTPGPWTPGPEPMPEAVPAAGASLPPEVV